MANDHDKGAIDAVEEMKKARADHGTFDETERRKRGPRGARMMTYSVVVIGALGFCLFLALSLRKMDQREQVSKAEQQKKETLVSLQDNDWKPAEPSTVAIAPVSAATVSAPASPGLAVTPKGGSAVPAIDVDASTDGRERSYSGSKDEVLTPAQAALARRLKSGFVSDKQDSDSESSKPDATAAGNQAILDAIKGKQDGGLAGGGSSDGDAKPSNGGGLEDKLQPLKLQPSRAGYTGSRDFLILRGTTIDCGLRGNLDTTVPGMVSCVTTRPTWSDNMRVILIDAGSKVTGFVQSAPAQGQARVFVTWQRIQTPQGVIIDVDSPATDAEGTAGIAGTVNNHWWARFGGGFSLSLVSDLGQALANSQNSGSSTVSLQTTSNTSESMIGEVLKASVNIPPTITANRAQRVTIAVIRDLDFSSVYELKH